MIYQQLNSQGFHIGTSAHDDWREEKGALDTEAPGHDTKTHRARWVAATQTWDIRTNEEWEAELNPPNDLTLEQARESASLSRADFKLGLLDMGELDAVKAVMADPETPERVVIMWEDSARFNRMHPDILSFAQVMGYTEQQLDHLFGVMEDG